MIITIKKWNFIRSLFLAFQFSNKNFHPLDQLIWEVQLM
jgi:hypothetical protein